MALCRRLYQGGGYYGNAPSRTVYYTDENTEALDMTGFKVIYETNSMDGGAGLKSDVTSKVKTEGFDGSVPGTQRTSCHTEVMLHPLR